MSTFTQKIHWLPQEKIARSGCFFVGGRYHTDESGQTSMTGQMYVEVYVPQEVRHPYPLVMIHGAAQTSLNWVYTADGRPGWLYYFLEQGYTVYLVDQPARGRSCYNAFCDGPIENWTVEKTKKVMVGEEATIDPEHLPHTQFPQEHFEDFYKTQVNLVHDRIWGQKVGSAAVIALLEEIGPAVLFTHSQSGPYGWAVTDACPELVKGVVAMEPSGPAYPERFADTETQTIGKGMFVFVPLHFDPPVTENDPVRLAWAEGRNSYEKGGWLQKEPCRTLPNLQGKPMLLLTSETSVHVEFDHLTARGLQQCGVDIRHINLGDIGIHGNGHMMMLENNSDEIAAYVAAWLREKNL